MLNILSEKTNKINIKESLDFFYPFWILVSFCLHRLYVFICKEHLVLDLFLGKELVNNSRN